MPYYFVHRTKMMENKRAFVFFSRFKADSVSSVSGTRSKVRERALC